MSKRLSPKTEAMFLELEKGGEKVICGTCSRSFNGFRGIARDVIEGAARGQGWLISGLVVRCDRCKAAPS